MALYTLTESDLRELGELDTYSLGVLKKDSATAMSNTARVLVVGLGGVGLDTVYQLKKRLIERVGELRGSDIQFLAIDTDRKDLNNKIDSGVLSKSETIHMHNNTIGALMQIPENMRPAAVKAIFPPPGVPFNPTLAGDGANQVRLAGRLSLMDYDAYNQICSAISNAIRTLHEFNTRVLEIHVVAGIGGGTGSGLCVDIPYIIRKVAQSLSVPDNHMRLFGHIFLPNIYKGVESINIQQAYHNGYAALKEIDYYMNIEEIGEKYVAKYPDMGANESYICGKNIFSVCTLISGQIASAISVQNRKEYAINTCVSSMINEVTRVVSKNDIAGVGLAASMADIFTADSFRDNARAALEVVLNQGSVNFHNSGNYKYTVIGASSLKFPTEAIIEYFVGKAFATTVQKLESSATMLKQDDIDSLARGVLAPADLMKGALEEYENQFTTHFGSNKWGKDNVTDKGVETEISGIVTDIVKLFDEKGDMVDKAWTRIDQKAGDIFRNPAKGPFYLARMLTESSSMGGMMGYFEKLDRYAAACAENIERIQDAISKKKADKEKLEGTISKKLFGASKQNIDSYVEMLKEIGKDELRVKLYTKLQTEYYLTSSSRIGACYQLRSKLEQKYLSRADILGRIRDILTHNAEVREKEIYQDASEGSIFELTDEIFDNLKNFVRHDVSTQLKNFDDPAVASFAAALLGNMADYPERWNLTGESVYGRSECAKTFRSFILNYEPFAPVTGRTFTSYFEDAYRNEPANRRSSIVQKIVEHMNTNAAPMFNVYPTVSWASLSLLKHNFMIIPSNMGDEWGALFTQHLAGRNQNVLVSPDQNAMYNYTMYISMPIWVHADLVDYEKDYLSIRVPGEHINESAEMKPTYREYPALMAPQQYFRIESGYQNPDELKIQEDLKVRVDKALACGVLAKNDMGNFELRTLAKHPSEEELAVFFGKYKDEPENFGEDGILLGGANLITALGKAYGVERANVARLCRVYPNEESVMAELIRRQMGVFGKLREEMNYIDGTVMKVYDSIVEGERAKQQIRDYAICLLYGLIDVNERGVWNYHLGEREFKIISKLEVSTGAMSSMVNYMEMAAYKIFNGLEKRNEHMILMKDRVQSLNASIIDGTFDIAILKDAFAKYKSKSDDILNKFKLKVAMGDKLSLDEQAIKVFYETLIGYMQTVISTFSFD